ncbi:tectonic-1-like isoform X1 [Tribolium madens]|uniref:tectonic-1-like isoform X1 n=1 Tax=Tribolium madens TaxID=41895 RepID=UPI001CF7454A|nr:tectonic-1-like isoform X1 [Tribolium madens]
MKASEQSSKNLCICDLTVDYCDLNCCCDKDCSLENKLVFDHCEKDFRHYDTRYCQYMKHIYLNKTPHEFQINQNGLFCIVRSNLPASYIVQRKKPLKSLQDAQFERQNRFIWPKPKEEYSEIFNYFNYTFGKSLWTLRNNTIETLHFLKSFMVTSCVVKEDIKYLIDVKSSCSHTDISGDNYYLKADTFFRNMTIIANPGLLNVSSKNKNFLQNCPKNVCLNIQPKICNEDFEDCVQISKNDTRIKSRCKLNTVNNELSCINLVQSVRYNFYHNGSSGLIKVELYLILKSATFYYHEEMEFSQTIEANFIWWNHTLNYSSHLSGNPGYLVGKPILIANIILVNVPISNTSSTSNATSFKQQLRLYRNPFDFTENFLVLPFVNSEGVCALSKHKYTPIEFGYNIYLKCEINDYLWIKNLSAKNICIAIQETIFRYWALKTTNSTLSNKVIAQFGNAYVYNMGDWLRPMFENDLKDILNRTWGEFDRQKKFLKCGNITTLLITEIFHARVDFEDVINQEKILATTFQFDNFKNITFTVDLNHTFQFNIIVSTQVMFHDITTKKMRKLVDPPSLKIRLPHDFFYPFVKIDNHAVKQTPFINVIVVGLIFVFTSK